MGLLCYPFSLDWETFSGAKVRIIFESASVLHKKMQKNAYFFLFPPLKGVKKGKTALCR